MTFYDNGGQGGYGDNGGQGGYNGYSDYDDVSPNDERGSKRKGTKINVEKATGAITRSLLMFSVLFALIAIILFGIIPWLPVGKMMTTGLKGMLGGLAHLPTIPVADAESSNIVERAAAGISDLTVQGKAVTGAARLANGAINAISGGFWLLFESAAFMISAALYLLAQRQQMLPALLSAHGYRPSTSQKRNAAISYLAEFAMAFASYKWYGEGATDLVNQIFHLSISKIDAGQASAIFISVLAVRFYAEQILAEMKPPLAWFLIRTPKAGKAQKSAQPADDFREY